MPVFLKSYSCKGIQKGNDNTSQPLQQGAVLEDRVNHWCVLELLATASVSVFGISGGLFERQVRKMACHFTLPSEFLTPQKRQLRFALRKRPYAEVFGTFYRYRKYGKKRLENKYKPTV